MTALWDVGEVSEKFAKVTVALTDEERGMLVSGLIEWGGPADVTESLAAAMGFSTLKDLDVGMGNASWRTSPRPSAVGPRLDSSARRDENA